MGYFFDAEEGGPLRLELRSVDGRDFTVLRRIAYASDDYAEAFVVPRDRREFTTDLASVPGVFTWLVPTSGEFLPAAVLHDALVRPGSYLGPRVDRPEADRIFREAMIELGTGRVRAWLMWAAVTLSTMWHSPRAATRVALVGVLAVIPVLGLLATLDVLDVADVVPWIDEHSTVVELLTGAMGALVIPSVLSLTWGRFWPAGVILGVALAFLLHVTAVLSILYGAYLLVERVVSGPADERGVRVRDRRRPG